VVRLTVVGYRARVEGGGGPVEARRVWLLARAMLDLPVRVRHGSWFRFRSANSRTRWGVHETRGRQWSRLPGVHPHLASILRKRARARGRQQQTRWWCEILRACNRTSWRSPSAHPNAWERPAQDTPRWGARQHGGFDRSPWPPQSAAAAKGFCAER